MISRLTAQIKAEKKYTAPTQAVVNEMLYCLQEIPRGSIFMADGRISPEVQRRLSVAELCCALAEFALPSGQQAYEKAYAQQALHILSNVKNAFIKFNTDINFFPESQTFSRLRDEASKLISQAYVRSAKFQPLVKIPTFVPPISTASTPAAIPAMPVVSPSSSATASSSRPLAGTLGTSTSPSSMTPWTMPSVNVSQSVAMATPISSMTSLSSPARLSIPSAPTLGSLPIASSMMLPQDILDPFNPLSSSLPSSSSSSSNYFQDSLNHLNLSPPRPEDDFLNFDDDEEEEKKETLPELKLSNLSDNEEEGDDEQETKDVVNLTDDNSPPSTPKAGGVIDLTDDDEEKMPALEKSATALPVIPPEKLGPLTLSRSEELYKDLMVAYEYEYGNDSTSETEVQSRQIVNTVVQYCLNATVEKIQNTAVFLDLHEQGNIHYRIALLLNAVLTFEIAEKEKLILLKKTHLEQASALIRRTVSQPNLLRLFNYSKENIDRLQNEEQLEDQNIIERNAKTNFERNKLAISEGTPRATHSPASGGMKAFSSFGRAQTPPVQRPKTPSIVIARPRPKRAMAAAIATATVAPPATLSVKKPQIPKQKPFKATVEDYKKSMENPEIFSQLPKKGYYTTFQGRTVPACSIIPGANLPTLRKRPESKVELAELIKKDQSKLMSAEDLETQFKEHVLHLASLREYEKEIPGLIIKVFPENDENWKKKKSYFSKEYRESHLDFYADNSEAEQKSILIHALLEMSPDKVEKKLNATARKEKDEFCAQLKILFSAGHIRALRNINDEIEINTGVRAQAIEVENRYQKTLKAKPERRKSQTPAPIKNRRQIIEVDSDDEIEVKVKPKKQSNDKFATSKLFRRLIKSIIEDDLEKLQIVIATLEKKNTLHLLNLRSTVETNRHERKEILANETGFTPLMYAAKYCHNTDIFKLLLNKGANLLDKVGEDNVRYKNKVATAEIIAKDEQNANFLAFIASTPLKTPKAPIPAPAKREPKKSSLADLTPPSHETKKGESKLEAKTADESVFCFPAYSARKRVGNNELVIGELFKKFIGFVVRGNTEEVVKFFHVDHQRTYLHLISIWDCGPLGRKKSEQEQERGFDALMYAAKFCKEEKHRELIRTLFMMGSNPTRIVAEQNSKFKGYTALTLAEHFDNAIFLEEYNKIARYLILDTPQKKKARKAPTESSSSSTPPQTKKARKENVDTQTEEPATSPVHSPVITTSTEVSEDNTRTTINTHVTRGPNMPGYQVSVSVSSTSTDTSASLVSVAGLFGTRVATRVGPTLPHTPATPSNSSNTN